MSGQIITQQGDPVEEKADQEAPDPKLVEDIRGLAEEVNEGIKGFRKFRNSIILKIGIVAVAIKVVDVVGKIMMENQRLKAEAKKQDDEQ